MIDLTQLRWQSIRAIELQQSTGATLYHTTNGISSKKPYADIENITLRSKVAALKSSENSLKKESENLKAALAQTIRLVQALKYCIDDLKKDTKAALESESKKCFKNKETISNSLNILMATAYENTSLKGNLQAVLRELNALKDENHGASKVAAKEIEFMRSKLASLENDMLNAEVQISAKSTENKILREQLEASKLEKKEISDKFEAAAKENKALLEMGFELESKATRNEWEHSEATKKLTDNYRKQISALEEQNKTYFSTILHLQEQVAHLTQALQGNKTHFAKFMEVKTENASLQAKLKAVTQEIADVSIRSSVNRHSFRASMSKSDDAELRHINSSNLIVNNSVLSKTSNVNPNKTERRQSFEAPILRQSSGVKESLSINLRSHPGSLAMNDSLNISPTQSDRELEPSTLLSLPPIASSIRISESSNSLRTEQGLKGTLLI